MKLIGDGERVRSAATEQHRWTFILCTQNQRRLFISFSIQTLRRMDLHDK